MVTEGPGRGSAVLTVRDGGLASIFQRHVPEAHWQLVETAGTGRGVPDANYCLRGAEGWIELKQVVGWRIPSLRPEQVAWAERRTRAGGRVFLAARKGGAFWLWAGADARHVLDLGVREVPPLIHAAGGPAGWPWVRIMAVLAAPLRPPKRISKRG